MEGTRPITEWLDLQQDDEYYPESLALSPTEPGFAQAPLEAPGNEDRSCWAYEPLNAVEPQCEVVDYSDVSSRSGETSSDSERSKADYSL